MDTTTSKKVDRNLNPELEKFKLYFEFVPVTATSDRTKQSHVTA